jgi:hypothetical protein
MGHRKEGYSTNPGIGITSFTLRDSQGLNFAIAVEDYFR